MIEIIQHKVGPNNRGGLAILATHKKGDSFITVVTEPCSFKDSYCKKIAVQYLRLNMELGRFIRLPINPERRNKVNHRDLRDHVRMIFENT